MEYLLVSGRNYEEKNECPCYKTDFVDLCYTGLICLMFCASR